MQFAVRRRGAHHFDFMKTIKHEMDTGWRKEVPNWYPAMKKYPPFLQYPSAGTFVPKLVFPEDKLRKEYKVKYPIATPTMVDMFVRRQWSLMDKGFSKSSSFEMTEKFFKDRQETVDYDTKLARVQAERLATMFSTTLAVGALNQLSTTTPKRTFATSTTSSDKKSSSAAGKKDEKKKQEEDEEDLDEEEDMEEDFGEEEEMEEDMGEEDMEEFEDDDFEEGEMEEEAEEEAKKPPPKSKSKTTSNK